MRRGLIIAMLLAFGFAYTQEKTAFSKEEQRNVEDAREFFQLEDYAVVKELLSPLIFMNADNPELQYMLGVALFHLPNDHHKSFSYLEKALNLGNEKARYYYASVLFEKENIKEAKHQFLLVKDSAQGQRVQRQLAYMAVADSLINNPQTVVLQNLGSSINSSFSEHTPLISWDDSLLFFTSRRPIDASSVTDFEEQYDENIYFSIRSGNQWQKAIPLPGNVNDILNEATVSLSPEADQMLVFQTTRDLQSSDLYWANRKDDNWKLGSKLPKSINSSGIETGSALNSNQNTFIISSNREGGYGGFDLYRVVQFGNGEFSEPVNLGPTVNTEWDEQAPFLLPDDRTLYFASNRKGSMGGLDIFSTKKLDANLWTGPINLGYPINSTQNDAHLSVSWKTGQAYFTRNKTETPGDYDIYTANLPGFNVPATIFKIQILNSDILNYNALSVIFAKEEVNKEGVIIANYRVGAKGAFLVALLPGESGVLRIEADGFQLFEKSLSFEPGSGIKEFALPINLTPAAK